MAANEKNIGGGLARIKFPNLDEGEFGQSLAKQFKNIDLNFQKLGNLNLGKGDDGAGCTYINYNLNSIFFYWTGYSDNSKAHTELNPSNKDVRALVERQNFRGFNKFIMGNENPLRARMEQLKKEVDADIQEFKDLTGGTEEDYVRMCAFLLFGQPMVFDHYKKTPETCSLFGALMTEYGKSAQASVGGTTYSSMWLLDWWNAEYKTNITDMKPAEYGVGDDRVDLFLTHMQLFDPGRITVAVAPALDNDKYAVGNYHPVGSLAYVYLDPRFRNHATGDEVDDASQWAGQSEISCVLYWSPRPLGHMHITSNDGSWDDHTCTGGFKVVNLFPQMYFDGTGFYWKINGTETKIPVTGRPGTDGKNSQFVVVERIGNIKDAVYNSCCYDKESKLWGPWPLKQTTYYEEWLGKEKLIRTAHSGRASRNENNSAYESAQKWVTDHINAHFDITKEKPAENTERFETTYGVASVDIKALEGWLPDATGFNSTEILHLYRIWGIVGRECFWRVKEGAKQRDDADYIPFRLSDPSYSKYNFGRDDAVELITNGATQNQMKALDGAPCIVVADPAYIYDRTNTTVWFSTLKAVKAFANKDDNNIMLVAYCGDENQMTTEIDDHGMAGIMQHLDPYTYKSTGSNRNKPRGLMLPIGSAEITDSRIASDIYGSHIIHSDLGGFVKRGTNAVVVDDERRTVNEYYGVPRPYADALSDINGDTMRSNNKLSTHATDMLKDPQFGEIKYKRFMHIGSVDDFRTLDYIPGPDEFSPAVPGRRTDHTFLKEGLFGRKSSVPYGTAGFFGSDLGAWFVGSELHIDEPVTITRYRDLRRKGTLLRIEGDTIIGPHKHINFRNEYLHNRRDGGLFVQSTLTDELLEDQEGIWDHSVFHNVFGKGILPKFRAYTRNIQGTNDQKEDWNTTLCRTKTDQTKKFKNGWLGSWLAQDKKGQDIYDDVSNKNGLEPNKEARASILADDMIGARMMLALDGLAIIDQTYIDNKGNLSIDATPFSVDHKGNIQTLGSEVRSNAQDTFWAFHTRWMHENRLFEISGDTPTGFRHTTVPTSNKLMFGTNHQLYKILFDSKNGGSLQEGFNHWRYANMTEYLSYEDDGRTLTTRIPSQLSAGYVTNIGYAETKNNVEVFGTAFNTDTGLRIKQNGDLMPFITRMWCDLLYQEGALAVKGVHYMPVTTSFLGENYSGRYGANIAYGLVIGGEGAAIGDPTVTTLNQLKARYNAHENGEYTQLDSDDTLGTYNSIDGSDLKWASGDMNMFTSATNMTETPIGIWSRPGILTEESLIAQKDLWIGRVASVRGQARAMSFRRHANAWTHSLYKRDWAFLLDTGLSSYTAPRHTKVHGNTSDDEGFTYNSQTPLVLDIGKKFGPRRLVRFGSAKSVKLKGQNYEVSVKNNAGDNEICLFGRYPEGLTDLKANHTKLPFISGAYASNTKNSSYSKNAHPVLKQMYTEFGWGTPSPYCHEESVVVSMITEDSVYVKVYIFMNHVHRCSGKTYWYGMCEGGLDRHDGRVQDTTHKSVISLPQGTPTPKVPLIRLQNGLRTNESFDPSGHGTGRKYKVKSAPSGDTCMLLQLNPDGTFSISYALDPDWWYPAHRNFADEYGPVLTFDFSYQYDWTSAKSTEKNPEIGGDDTNITTQTPKYRFVVLKKDVPNDWDVTDEEITYDGEDERTPVYPNISTASSVYNDYETVVGEEDDDEEFWLKIAEQKVPDLIKSLSPQSPYLAIEYIYGSGANEDHEYMMLKSLLAAGNSLVILSQSTDKGLLGSNDKTQYLSTGAQIVDGTFIQAGKFAAATANENGYVTSVPASATNIPVNTFSVRYWESGAMCYLRLRVMLDKQDSMKKDSNNWGLIGMADEYFTPEQQTNAWLPLSAKMPLYPVSVHFGGSSHWWRSSADRDYCGAVGFRLDTNGQIMMENAFHARDLIYRYDNGSHPTCPMLDLLFIYQPHPDNTMTDQHYRENGNNDSGNDQTGGGVTPPSTPGGTDTSTTEVWLWEDNDPTTTNVLSWLKDTKRTDLLASIKDCDENSDVGEIDSLAAAYGEATIRKDADGVRVSIICSAYKEGANDWSHRSISFTYHNDAISKLSSYIIGNSSDDATGGTGGGGPAYDDTALKNRISSLETKLAALETKLANLAMLVPQNISINMAADQTEAQIQVQAINADGNEITLDNTNLQITNDSSVTVS